MDWIEINRKNNAQQTLFPDLDRPPKHPPKNQVGKKDLRVDVILESPGVTTLDRVHIAMLLHEGGYTNALRTLIIYEQKNGPDFLRLANALSALYPPGSRDKRILDAMILAVPT